jgi:hypothetical protein
MINAPYYQPGPSQKVYNGDVAMSRDARAIDRATAWLATHRFARPALVGAPIVAGQTYSLRTLVPGYCEFVAFGLLVSGHGTVTIESSDSSDNSVTTFDIAGTTIGKASWIWLDEPKNIAGDGYERALSVTDQSTPHEVTFSVVAADGSGDPVKVWQVLLSPLARIYPLA